MVPQKIAVRELLPATRRDPGYLAANDYQVLNQEGTVINPASIHWRALSAGNFPYSIRQGTGCDNALGLVKLNFYNPFTVYWHNTPKGPCLGLTSAFSVTGACGWKRPWNWRKSCCTTT